MSPPPTTRLLATFTTNARGTLHDALTCARFVRETLRLLQTPALATITQDVATALEPYGEVASNDERGILAVGYASLAGVQLRTYPSRGYAEADLHSYKEPIDPTNVLALVLRHFATKEVQVIDLGQYVAELREKQQR